jgi:8-oxo-dGTP pyrophosphatase MutT (NUDIX family)
MSVKTHGPWTILKSEERFRTAWIVVEDHEVTRPDGQPGQYGVVRFQNRAIGILPLFADGTVPMVGQFRFPLGRETWELPEGGGPLAADPLGAAQRELKEETGAAAANWHAYGEADLSNSVTDERAHLFLAWDLTEGEAEPEPDEIFAYRRISFADLLAEIHAGKVDDALTQLLVLTALSKAISGELPDRPRAIILNQIRRP